MVYCGKPSKGCSSCRERKIRCDQKEPGCGQCEKRQQQCPGYRNLVDLMFRDESSHVIKKAAKTKARGRLKNVRASGTIHDAESSEHAPATTSTGTDPESSDPSSRPIAKPGAPTPLYSLSPSWQERGTAFFFSRYVSADENACHLNYDYIFDIWRPASMLPDRQVDGVMASMTAVGLAGLSHLTMCPEMMDWSRRSYGTALQMTNDALQNTTEALKDTTMLSILILGTYETLSGRSSQTVRAWQNHINGASALAKMRGLKQFTTRAGARMFVMLTQIVLINCMQKDMPMPQPLVDLRNQLGVLSGGTDANWRISGPIYKVMQLRHDINSGKLSQTAEIIDQLSKVDREFADIISDLPEPWKYRHVKLSKPHPAVFDGYHCDVYPNLGLAATWNGVRSIRLMVHETIVGELFKCFPDQHITTWPHEAKLQLANSAAFLEKLRDAVIASAPQHFGVVSFKDAMSESGGSAPAVITAKKPPAHIVLSPTTSASSTTPASVDDATRRPAVFNGPTLHDPAHMKGRRDNAERFMTLASATNTVVWPLYLVGVSSCGTEEVKSYVVERLQAILEESGLLQARGVALMVRDKEVCIPWADVPWDQMPRTQIPSDLFV
ncbi:hypothetical protein LZ32DRAFT_581069 [Colletotrichum eremochloae]|nr:hypothetical protein LZ32DRAFT_581069 [Colletotrichum eremochloae]